MPAGSAEGCGDGGEIGEHGVGAGGGELGGGVRAGRDAPTRETRGVGGGDVERGIADEERGRGRGGELGEGVGGELGLGL